MRIRLTRRLGTRATSRAMSKRNGCIDSPLWLYLYPLERYCHRSPTLVKDEAEHDAVRLHRVRRGRRQGNEPMLLEEACHDRELKS